MIKYHGTPLTPMKLFHEIMPSKNCLIPYPNPQDLHKALAICDKVIIDNGAFTLWTKGGVIDWNKYYEFINKHIDNIEFFFIPDVIDGTEEENDKLIADYMEKYRKDYEYTIDGYCGMNKLLCKGVPIWHINESFERLQRLMDNFNYIAIGSAGEYSQLGSYKWKKRMHKAMKVLCNKKGKPKVRIHMLRCLNHRIFTQYPFHSGDSASLARNHHRDGAQNILDRVEKHDSPKRYDFKKHKKSLKIAKIHLTKS